MNRPYRELFLPSRSFGPGIFRAQIWRFVERCYSTLADSTRFLDQARCSIPRTSTLPVAQVQWVGKGDTDRMWLSGITTDGKSPTLRGCGNLMLLDAVHIT